MDIVLINPPVTKPGEPPAGLAKLVGALKHHGRPCLAIDANMEGLMSLLDGAEASGDTWTRRAVSHLGEDLASLRNGDAFRNMGSYTRAVTDIDRILSLRGKQYGTHVSLNNFRQGTLSPVRSTDLVRSAENPEASVFYPYFERRFRTVLEEHAPRMVGFSLNYLSQALTTFAMIGFIRRMSPRVKIILGGGLVTSWMRGPGWSAPFEGLVDELVAGPGEERLLSLAGGEHAARPSLPDYGPFWGYGYLSPGRVVPFSTSWGCYWGRCSFCPEKAEGNAFSCLSPETVTGALAALREENSPGLVHLCDNALSPALLRSLAAQEAGVPWYGFARFTGHLADPDFCSALARSGCVMLKLGLESGDQKVLDALGKGIRLEEAARVLACLHKAGIATYVYLLFGTPAEDEASARKTLEFIATHHRLVDFLNTSIFNLPRGSAEARELDTYDFSQGDLSLYQGFAHPKGWDRNRVRQFLDKEFKRSPAISRIIRRDPPVFTSNHAPFFMLKASGARRQDP